MTMQMMKTTARTGPTTQMSPSPASKGWGSESGAVTDSVYGLATYIFCKQTYRVKAVVAGTGGVYTSTNLGVENTLDRGSGLH